MYDSVDSGNDQIDDNLFPPNMMQQSMLSPRCIHRSMKVKSYKEIFESLRQGRKEQNRAEDNFCESLSSIDVDSYFRNHTSQIGNKP